MSDELAAAGSTRASEEDADTRVHDDSSSSDHREFTSATAALNAPAPSENTVATSSTSDATNKYETSQPLAAASSFERAFSAAQLDAKVRQARLEAKIVADEQALVLRKRIVELEHEARELQRSAEQAAERHEHLQRGVDTIVSAHKRTLHGMREEDISVHKLVAALEVEKAARESLSGRLEQQTAELLAAQERAEGLAAQLAKYQKTETVLAQSISHLQHRFDHKDQRRVAALERARRELEDQHRQEVEVLRRDAEAAAQAESQLQEQLLALETAHRALEKSVQTVQVREQQSGSRVEQLETDKAVLVRKAEQLQKADAQLRSRLRALEDELSAQRIESAALRAEVAELSQIGSDLMEMAERHQQEKRARQGLLRDEDTEFLATRKKRLRMSIG